MSCIACFSLVCSTLVLVLLLRRAIRVLSSRNSTACSNMRGIPWTNYLPGDHSQRLHLSRLRSGRGKDPHSNSRCAIPSITWRATHRRDLKHISRSWLLAWIQQKSKNRNWTHLLSRSSRAAGLAPTCHRGSDQSDEWRGDGSDSRA
jgi:hypothetical protein